MCLSATMANPKFSTLELQKPFALRAGAIKLAQACLKENFLICLLSKRLASRSAIKPIFLAWGFCFTSFLHAEVYFIQKMKSKRSKEFAGQKFRRQVRSEKISRLNSIKS